MAPQDPSRRDGESISKQDFVNVAVCTGKVIWNQDEHVFN